MTEMMAQRDIGKSQLRLRGAILASTFSISRFSLQDHAPVPTPEVRNIGTPYAEFPHGEDLNICK